MMTLSSYAPRQPLYALFAPKRGISIGSYGNPPDGYADQFLDPFDITAGMIRQRAVAADRRNVRFPPACRFVYRRCIVQFGGR